jgi:APA family basic amino acid/polyamine antiporter
MDTEHRPHASTDLLKVLGVTFGIAVSIGGMIGLGILRTPGTVTGQLQHPWLILAVWAAGAVYALFGVFAVAELGVSIPKTGGWYAFARRAFGEYAGFAMAWMDWLGYPATLALCSVTAGDYAGKLFKPLAGKTVSTGIAIMLLLGLINWIGIKSGGRFQEVLSFVKAGALVVIVAAAFIIGSPSTAGETHATAGGIGLLASVVVALQAVIYTYDGWYAAVYFSEENTDPAKSLPKAMVSAVILVAAIYLLVNAALLYALPISQLAASELPVADVANNIFGDYGDKVMTSLALITILSLQNSNLLTGPRIMYAVSRDGLFLRKAAEVNSGGTPAVALLIVVAATIPIILTSSFESILALVSFLFIILYLSGFLAVIVLRRKEPDLPRPYKAWGYPWTTLIVIAGSFAFLIAALVTDTRNSLYAVAIMAASYPGYLLLKRFNRPAA